MSMRLYEATRKFSERTVICAKCGYGISTDEHIIRCLYGAGWLPLPAGGRA